MHLMEQYDLANQMLQASYYTDTTTRPTPSDWHLHHTPSHPSGWHLHPYLPLSLMNTNPLNDQNYRSFCVEIFPICGVYNKAY